jgi:hypothetical protein
MSHRIGTFHVLSPAKTIGPDSGTPATSPNTWLFDFTPDPAPAGTKFVLLHFNGVSFPANNRLEVDLGYDTDRFTAADGPDFWTRPIKLSGAGTVAIRYITNGSGSGQVVLAEYGRGEPMESVITNDPNFHNFTNPDIFLLDSPYVEPLYETRGFCNTSAANWENVACVPAGDVRAIVAKSVCLFIHVEIDEYNQQTDLSSCTGTLIAPDMVLCAGHCVSDPDDLNAHSGSVTFDFQTNCDATRPTGYNPQFYKVNKVIRSSTGSLDYSILQLKTPVVGVPTVPMRSDLPFVGDQVFEVHHPQAIIKKISARHTGPQATISSISSTSGFTFLFADCDLTGGSSGSALFDMSGRIIGIADVSGHCANGYLSVTEVLRDIASQPPSVKRDVMMVLDRSGSMSMDAGTGRTKIEEARDAASLFVQLIRAGQGDQIGMVSFSTTASSPVDFDLTAVNVAAKNTLIGSAPYSGGIVGALVPGGSTTIGGGLEAAVNRFPPPGPSANRRTVFLMTDGLQNTLPMIADADPFLAGTDLSVVGFGTESSLNGALLDHLAQEHSGLYTRAGSALDLKKFFALAFGNIFEAGTLSDPDYFLPAQQNSMLIPFLVCSDDTITVVLGWDRSDTSLLVQLQTPGGNIVSTGSAGVESAMGRTWMFMRVTLPFNGERDGSWQAQVFRPGGGEFPPPAVDLNFFINVVVKGGPTLVRLNPGQRCYTADKINPLVRLRNSDGTTPRNAKVKLTVTAPTNGAGNLLSQAKLGPSTTLDADTLPARQSTLQALEAASGKPAITYADQTFDLFDDARHEDGAMEPDGIFGNPLSGLLKMEGHYAFRAVASYGDTCTATREALWSLYLDVGVDPGQTAVTVNLGRSNKGTIIVTPRDSFGNNLGPGRGDGMTITGAPGTTVTGPVKDNGDGSYTVPISWNAGSGQGPGVVVGQPGRPPVLVQPKAKHPCRKWKWLVWLLLLVILILLLRKQKFGRQ